MAGTKRKTIKKSTTTKHSCPYCDAEIADASFPFCKVCRVTIWHCPVCHGTLERGTLKCPHCGTEIKEGS